MNFALRRIALFIGLGLLFVSMNWSQDGFNFNIAGDSGFQTTAKLVGWFLAISVTVVQFVFSSNYRELNPSLIVFGILAYTYSIYTNYQGIIHFQGSEPSKIGAAILGVVMDGVPEPLISWALYESLTGDFIGNLIKAIFVGNSRSGFMNMKNSSSEESRENRRDSKSFGYHPSNNIKKREVSPDLRRKIQSGQSKSGMFHNIKDENSDKRNYRSE